ncbi:MAG: hypothetical protein V1704_04525 [Candidatus Vogelbacteria bacterium]
MLQWQKNAIVLVVSGLLGLVYGMEAKMVVAETRLFSILKRGLPDVVECSLVPPDSLLPSRVEVSSEVMAALLFLTIKSEEIVTSKRLVQILTEMETSRVSRS